MGGGFLGAAVPGLVGDPGGLVALVALCDAGEGRGGGRTNRDREADKLLS